VSVGLHCEHVNFQCDISYVASSHAGWLQRLLTPRERRLDGKFVLTVDPATPPTNYIYENLATGWLSRLMRRVLSNTIVTLVLIISFVLIVFLKSAQKDMVVRASSLLHDALLFFLPATETPRG
jgi:hypothetical protein